MIFPAVYSKESQIPQNPLKELDEFYGKDEKIKVMFDLENYVREEIKEKEDKKFKEEIQKLQSELISLEEGKNLSVF